MKKPIIGIISGKEYIEKGKFNKPIFCVNEDYINLIKECNGIPIIIPYTIDYKIINSFLKNIDGLLLIGGEDISLECFYKKKGNPRDNFEIEMYNYFKNNSKPVLGICRGMQLINVAEGGTLVDIEKSSISHSIGNDGWINYHSIIINENTKIGKILNEKEYTVSSVHHQQIEKLGKNIIISAYSSDSVIEAIESNDDNFVIAFQGHIEKCTNNFEKYKKIFDKFIEEASKNEKK